MCAVAPTLASHRCRFSLLQSSLDYHTFHLLVNIMVRNIELTIPYMLDRCLLLLCVVSLWDNFHAVDVLISIYDEPCVYVRPIL